MPNKKDNPNVIAPPPLIFLSGLSVGGFVAWHHHVAILPNFLARILGVVLVFAGLAIILTAIVQMRKSKTNVEPWKPTTAIIDNGLYGVSRNPIYLAMILVYLGVAFLFNSLWFLPFLPIVVLIIHFGVILREESYLESKFGAEYLNYKTKVRRWV
jgi:protein-S-isoprenylcysteine O-methyltransferase Ste14